MNRSQKSRLQAVNMKYVVAIKGLIQKEQIRYELIREELGQNQYLIPLKGIKWNGLILYAWIQKDRVKHIWEAKIQGKRQRGKPKRTWNKETALILQERENTWTSTLAKKETGKVLVKFCTIRYRVGSKAKFLWKSAIIPKIPQWNDWWLH